MVQLISAIGGSASGRKAASLIIQSVELLDSYKDTRTFRITYQSPKRTLTDKEVEKVRKKIIEKAKKKFRVKLKQ